EAGLPVALALRTPAAWLRDCATGREWLVCEPGRDDLLDQFRADAARARFGSTEPGESSLPLAIDEDDPARFIDGVGRIMDYLRAGDVFQVNLSRAWIARFDHDPDPVALYRRLRRLSPAPFSGLLRWGDA